MLRSTFLFRSTRGRDSSERSRVLWSGGPLQREISAIVPPSSPQSGDWLEHPDSPKPYLRCRSKDVSCCSLNDAEGGKGVGFGPGGGDGVGVLGFEAFDVAAVVLFGDFDGAVSKPALGFVDAILHGDLAAGVFAEFVVGLLGLPSKVAEPFANGAGDAVGAVGGGAGEDVGFFVGIPFADLDAGAHGGVPGVKGADLDEVGAVFDGDGAVQDGIGFAGGPEFPLALGELADAKSEGEFMADGEEEVAAGFGGGVDGFPGLEGGFDGLIGRRVEAGGGEFGKFEGFASGNKVEESGVVDIALFVGGQGFGDEKGFGLDEAGVVGAFDAGFLGLVSGGQCFLRAGFKPFASHGAGELADGEVELGAAGFRIRKVGHAEELAEGVFVLDAGRGFGIHRGGIIDGEELADGGHGGGALFGGIEAADIAAEGGVFNFFGFGAGGFLGEFGFVGLEAAAIAFFAKGKFEVEVAVSVAGGIGREFAAGVVTFEEAEGFHANPWLNR